MNNDQKDSIFTLLYAMVLIDNRVIKVEVDQFFLAVESILRSLGYVEIYLAKSHVSAWFVRNYKTVITEMKSPFRDGFLLEHIETLKLYEHRQIIFEMMQHIAVSDNEYHPLEHQFLETVANIWKLELTEL